jgi:hypothetical protein
MGAVMTDEFINNCVASAASLAQWFVGVPEQEMIGTLYQVRANIRADLAEKFGPDVAAVISEAFVAAVVSRRRELLLN